MSAECSKCGADLDYYLNCDACTQRARVGELETALNEIFQQAHSVGNAWIRNRASAALVAAPSRPEGDEEAVERVAKALEELVRLKDIADGYKHPAAGPARIRPQGYDEAKAAAWTEARAAIAALRGSEG